MGETDLALIRELLRLDLQPAYQSSPERTYGMTVAGWNIRWHAGPDGAVVLSEATRAKV
jgi:hypothetical protein